MVGFDEPPVFWHKICSDGNFRRNNIDVICVFYVRKPGEVSD